MWPSDYFGPDYWGSDYWAEEGDSFATGTSRHPLVLEGAQKEELQSGDLLRVDAQHGTWVEADDGPTITLDLDLSDRHRVTIADDRTLALTGGMVGQDFRILLEQDGMGGHLVTWFSGIRWPGGSAPTLTATADKADLFEFSCIDTGEYIGYARAQNV